MTEATAPSGTHYVHKGCDGLTVWDLSGGFCIRCHAEGLDVDDVEPLSERESAREASPSLGADRAQPSGDVQSGAAPGPDLREPLGRLVHDTRLAFNAELERPFVLDSWEERSPRQRELDMRIGEAVARYALTENAITWGTSCTSCARVLDSAYAETVRRETAEAERDKAREAAASDRGRAKAADATLAAIAEHCRQRSETAQPWAAAGLRSARQAITDYSGILAIIDGKEESSDG